MASPDITAPSTGHAQVYGEGAKNKNMVALLGIGVVLALILIAVIYYAATR
jgi:hypothetical protein